MQREPPLVVRLPRQAGQKEVRFAHLLSGEISVDVSEPEPLEHPNNLEERIDELQKEVRDLQRQFAEFRKQFE
jgi:uncharacterized protein YceH (UPF0502 family)